MHLSEIIQMIFERFGAFQLLWSFYITVVLGVIAYVSVSYEKSSPLLVRALVATGFLMFAVVNMYALDRVREQRNLLAENAEAIVTRTYSEAEYQNQTMEAERWRSIIDSNRPPQRYELFAFHIACSGLVICIIWILPGLLVNMRRIFSLNSSTIGVAKSNYPTATVSWLQNKKMWRLEGQYQLKVSDFEFTIPGQFEFDLASVPKPLWWLIAPFELSVTAPLVHDFIYSYGGKLPENTVDVADGKPLHITRATADNLFLEIMQGEGVSWSRRTLAYIAVRLVGVLFWKG